MCHFSRKSDCKKEKRVVSFTHEPDIICKKSTVGRHLAWENSRHLATLPLVFPPNDVWETSTKIPYWWRVSPQIWVVPLIAWIKFPTPHNQSEALPRSGEWRVISREFLRSFLRRHLAGETVVASPNVGCFLSLDDFAHGIPLFVGSYLKDTWWAFGEWNGKNCIEWLMYLWCKQDCEVVYDKYDHRGSPS